MKAKKALKRLSRVEALLSGVRRQFSAGEKEVLESLDSAKASIAQAWESVSRGVADAMAKKKVAVKAKKKKVVAKAEAKAKTVKTKAKIAVAKMASLRSAPKAKRPAAVKNKIAVTKRAAVKKRMARKPSASVDGAKPAELAAASTPA